MLPMIQGWVERFVRNQWLIQRVQGLYCQQVILVALVAECDKKASISNDHVFLGSSSAELPQSWLPGQVLLGSNQ